MPENNEDPSSRLLIIYLLVFSYNYSYFSLMFFYNKSIIQKYGFFEIIEKKSGLKFVICDQKTMPKKLRLALLELGGSPDNGSTRFEFPFEHALQVAESFFKFCMTPEIVELCQAQDYKPYKLLTADAKEPEEA